MNRILRRALLAASSLGVASGIALAALPASAAPVPVESWGVLATGPISLGPVAYADSLDTPGVASNANYGNVLVTGRIVDRASFLTAYSLVNSPLVQVDGVSGQADQLSSWCHIGDSGPIGGASIFNGTISVNGSVVYNIPRYPQPNTTVYAGGATITFNEQTTGPGQLQVAAVHLVDGPQDLWLGVTNCGEPL